MIEYEKYKIWTISNFLSDEECTKYIDQINNPKEIIPFTNSGLFENNKYVDNKLAQTFYQRLMLHNIDTVTPLIKANKLIMTGKYEPSDAFGLHTDTGLFYDRKKKLKSRYTLLIYLNDNFEGGSTQFYTDRFKPTFEIVPEKGKALLFDIDLWHQGKPLHSGNKYWIGCEIIAPF